MPTWRRWETNLANEDVEQTGYYRMLERMYESVPDELKEKVIILPHPLIAEQFRGEKGLGDHILMADSYDKVFRDCDLLITDYSSIAYDAFYRGANVVFDWEDLDECMEHYGEGSHLMLTEEKAFGRVCRSREELKSAVRESYGQAQKAEDIEKYRKIVEFHDGRNSERIIEKLIEDGMLEKRA
jgi:CDP-glycerol glycerophosphotransferase (TagB/SpsB family)